MFVETAHDIVRQEISLQGNVTLILDYNATERCATVIERM
jgi:hypothetical protein